MNVQAFDAEKHWRSQWHPAFRRRRPQHAEPIPQPTGALLVAWYNLARTHETLQAKTPAMASGLSDQELDD